MAATRCLTESRKTQSGPYRQYFNTLYNYIIMEVQLLDENKRAFLKNLPRSSVTVQIQIPCGYFEASEKLSVAIPKAIVKISNFEQCYKCQFLKKELNLYIWSFPPPQSMKETNSGNNEFPLQHMGWECSLPTGNSGPKTLISKTKLCYCWQRGKTHYIFPVVGLLNGFEFKQRPNIYFPCPAPSNV